MKLFLSKKFVLLAFAFLVALSCSKDEDSNQGPVINLVSPSGTISVGSDIDVHIQFSDDEGLSEVEVQLGKSGISNNVYSLNVRGLSGTSDELQYSVSPPVGVDITGTNYIYIKVEDIDGKQTILDEDFIVSDPIPPTINILSFDASSIQGGSPSQALLVYEFQDDAGVEYTSTELWQTDGAGNRTTLWDKEETNYPIPITITTQVLADLYPNSGWVTGTTYQILIKARDTNGNVVEDSSITGTVL